MRKRCLNPKHPKYPRYGGRGITICERWLNSFDNFIADMGPRPPKLTLERVDNNQGYDPFNCIWETRARNNANTEKNKASRIRLLENPPMEPWERYALRKLAKPVKISVPYIPQEFIHGSKKAWRNKKCFCDICRTAEKVRLKKIYARRVNQMTPEDHQKKLDYLKNYRERKRNQT